MRFKSNKIIVDHWKPASVIIISINLFIVGLLTGSLFGMFIFLLGSILAILVFFILSIFYGFIFLAFKGLLDKSDNINYGSILPWLKSGDSKYNENWQYYYDIKQRNSK